MCTFLYEVRCLQYYYYTQIIMICVYEWKLLFWFGLFIEIDVDLLI